MATDTSTPKTNVLATVSLVSGILGLLCLLPVLGSIVAIITGHMARTVIRKDPTQLGNGLALAGMLLGYISLFTIIVGIGLAVVFGAIGNKVQAPLIQYEPPKLEKVNPNNSEASHPNPSQPSGPSSSNFARVPGGDTSANLQQEFQEVMKAATPNPGDFHDIVQTYLKPFTHDAPLELEALPSLTTAAINSAPEVETKAWVEGDQIAIQVGDTTTLYDIDKVSSEFRARIANSLISGNHITDPDDRQKASRILYSGILNRINTNDSEEKSQ